MDHNGFDFKLNFYLHHTKLMLNIHRPLYKLKYNKCPTVTQTRPSIYPGDKHFLMNRNNKLLVYFMQVILHTTYSNFLPFKDCLHISFKIYIQSQQI